MRKYMILKLLVYIFYFFFSKLNEALKAIQNLTNTVSELEGKNTLLSKKVSIVYFNN